MRNLFPYTDAHELNLDWVIEQVKANNTKVKDLTHTVENLHFDFDSKADKATTYTKSEVDTLLLGKANVSDLPDMSNYYDKTATDNLLANKANVSDLPDMSNYYNKTTTDGLLNNKADKATTLTGYGITDAYTQNEVNTIASGLQSQIDTTILKIGSQRSDIINNSDLDNLTVNTNVICWVRNTATSAPFNQVWATISTIGNTSGAIKNQTFICQNGIAFRHFESNAWGAWKKVAFS